MGSVVKGMDKVLGSMNVEQISKVMEKFEQSFEDMDVRSEYVEQTMNASTTAAMPEEDVDTLMQAHTLAWRELWEGVGRAGGGRPGGAEGRWEGLTSREILGVPNSSAFASRCTPPARGTLPLTTHHSPLATAS